MRRGELQARPGDGAEKEREDAKKGKDFKQACCANEVGTRMKSKAVL